MEAFKENNNSMLHEFHRLNQLRTKVNDPKKSEKILQKLKILKTQFMKKDS